MDEIIVNLNDLYNIIRRMRRDDMTYVELHICPPEVMDGKSYPASLDISGIQSSRLNVSVDYDSIDASDVPFPTSGMSRNML